MMMLSNLHVYYCMAQSDPLCNNNHVRTECTHTDTAM